MFELLGLATAVVGVPLLMLYLVRRLDGSIPRHARSSGPLGWLRDVKLWHVAATIGLSAMIFAFLTSRHDDREPFLLLLILVGLVLIARAWRHEFVFLMSLRDDELPGRHDKLIWLALLLLLPPVGLWTFRAFRESRWPEPAPEPVHAHSKPAPEAL